MSGVGLAGLVARVIQSFGLVSCALCSASSTVEMERDASGFTLDMLVDCVDLTVLVEGAPVARTDSATQSQTLDLPDRVKRP